MKKFCKIICVSAVILSLFCSGAANISVFAFSDGDDEHGRVYLRDILGHDWSGDIDGEILDISGRGFTRLAGEVFWAEGSSGRGVLTVLCDGVSLGEFIIGDTPLQIDADIPEGAQEIRLEFQMLQISGEGANIFIITDAYFEYFETAGTSSSGQTNILPQTGVYTSARLLLILSLLALSLIMIISGAILIKRNKKHE
jgi:LPXTG-motif cell wall-anchored protein